MKKDLVYGYLEMVPMEQINELVSYINNDDNDCEMAFEIESQTLGLFSVSAYGLCDHCVADYYGFEPADDDFYDNDARYVTTKQLFERISSNK